MAFTQLDPPIPLHVIDRGPGVAISVIDYGQEFDLLWVVGMDDGGEIWCVPQPAGPPPGQLVDGSAEESREARGGREDRRGRRVRTGGSR